MSPYEVLGVTPDATDEEIARAYKRLAKRYHPDLNPGDAGAAERMGRINRAYDDIKAMRQRGPGPDPAGFRSGQGAYQGPFDPYNAGWDPYQSYRPRHSAAGMILAVLVMIFVIRLILSLLFGGFGGGYYFNPGYGAGPGGYYGYTQIYPWN